jgi:hypothetical protein
MEFYFPTELGEQLAFAAAAFAAAMGLVLMFAPGISLRFFGLQPRDGRPEGFAEIRSIGGFYIGLGLGALLLAQPMVYLALGAGFALALFARILSMASDHGATFRNYLLLIVQALLAALPLGYALGWI